MKVSVKTVPPSLQGQKRENPKKTLEGFLRFFLLIGLVILHLVTFLHMIRGTSGRVFLGFFLEGPRVFFRFFLAPRVFFGFFLAGRVFLGFSFRVSGIRATTAHVDASKSPGI